MEYLFRRQFVMGNIDDEKLPKTFIKEKIYDGCNIYHHKDLHFKRVDWEGKSLILLGYLINPYNYKASNGEILEKIIKSIVDFDDLCKKTLSLGGRWVIIYKDEEGF